MGGVDNWQRVKVVMTESRSKVSEIFMPTKCPDTTCSHADRRGCLKTYSHQHHLLLNYLELRIRNETYILSMESFLNVILLQFLSSLFQTLVITISKLS